MISDSYLHFSISLKPSKWCITNLNSIFLLSNLTLYRGKLVVSFQYKIWNKKRAHIQKLPLIKNSVFVQFSWNLVKILTSWGNHFNQVSWGLEKNWGFFANYQFLKMGPFFKTLAVFEWDEWLNLCDFYLNFLKKFYYSYLFIHLIRFLKLLTNCS